MPQEVPQAMDFEKAHEYYTFETEEILETILPAKIENMYYVRGLFNLHHQLQIVGPPG